MAATSRQDSDLTSDLGKKLSVVEKFDSYHYGSEPGPNYEPAASGTPVEPITMCTIHRMLSQVLEQTNALWRAQASNNRILDEIRQSMPAPQEYADIHERLRHVEDLAETLAQGLGRDGCPAPAQPSQGTDTTSNAHQTGATRGIPRPSALGSVDRLSCDDPTGSRSTMQTRATHHQTDRISPVNLDEYPTLRTQEHDAVHEYPQTNLLSGHIHHPFANAIISSGQTKLPETIISPTASAQNRDSLPEMTINPPPSTVPTDSVDPGIQGTSRDEHEFPSSSIPPTLDDSSTVPTGTILHTSGSTLDPPGVVIIKTEQQRQPEIAFSFEGFVPDRGEADITQGLSFTMEDLPGTTATKSDRSLHYQLADVANLIRRLLTYHEKEREDVEAKLTGLHIINEIQKIQREHTELLQIFLDAWKADSNKQTEEVVNAVRATANEQVPFNIQGYLEEFTRALGTEVRLLLTDIGSLREERRSLQHEIGFLLTTRSTFVPGADLDVDVPPDYSSPQAWPSPAGIPLPESPQPRPGWRAVSMQENRQARRPESPTAPERSLSWVTWQPNPALAPTPPSVEPTLLVPDRGSPGLFGPRSPRYSPRILPRNEPQSTSIPLLLSPPSPPIPHTADDFLQAGLTWRECQPNLPLTGSPEPQALSSLLPSPPPLPRAPHSADEFLQVESTWHEWRPDPPRTGSPEHDPE